MILALVVGVAWLLGGPAAALGAVAMLVAVLILEA